MTEHSGSRTVPAVSVFAVLAARKIKELCLSGAFFVLVLVQQVLFALLQRSAIQTLERDGMLVANHPAQYGLIAAAVAVVLFLIFFVAGSAARDRESGALETLFYGPVSAPVHVFADLAAVVVATIVSFVLLAAALLIGSGALGYNVPSVVLTLGGLSLISVISLVAVSMFLTYVFRQARAGTIATVALVAVSLLLFAGNYLLSRGDLSGAFFLIFVRATISGLDAVFKYVFPLGLFLDDIVRYIEQGSIPLVHLIYYPVHAAVIIYGTVRVMSISGVVVR